MTKDRIALIAVAVCVIAVGAFQQVTAQTSELGVTYLASPTSLGTFIIASNGVVYYCAAPLNVGEGDRIACQSSALSKSTAPK